MIELSIIIVNYKNQHLITQCVQSIVDTEPELQYEIIVIDNNSGDNTESLLLAIHPPLRWFQMGYNSGFGRANNLGICQAKGKYILLLNSDIIVKEVNTFKQCIDYLRNIAPTGNTILGVRLVNTDGSYQETLRLEFPGLKREITANAFYVFLVNRLLKKQDASKEHQKAKHYVSGKVEWINGAFLLMNRQQIIDKNLLFDQDFFLYGEDMEWCWRARKNGFRFFHWHQPELIHIGSASSQNSMVKHAQVIISDWLYLQKTRGRLFFCFILLVVLFNQLIDSFLNLQAQIRKKKFSESELKQAEVRKLTYRSLKKYGIKILFGTKFSEKERFYINCYA